MTDNYGQLPPEAPDARQPSIVMGEPAPFYYEAAQPTTQSPGNARRNCLIAVVVIGVLISIGALIWWLVVPSTCQYIVGQGGWVWSGSCGNCNFQCIGGYPSVYGGGCNMLL